MPNGRYGDPVPQIQFSLGKVVSVVFMFILGIFVLTAIPELWEHVSASDLVVIQAPFSGHLRWIKQPGTYWQGYGTVTSYARRSEYRFKVPVRFNDGGHGTMEGSLQWEMPLDDSLLTQLHQKFGSTDAIQKQLIEPTVNKAIYMTGPLMSSKESYAEKRNYLINYVDDQISHGVYKTAQREVSIEDALTKQQKTVVQVEVLMNGGVPERQESSALSQFGIQTLNFSIENIPYDDAVEGQIKQQQAITMDVQTAIAEARKAEQKAITVEQQGKAAAAQAKWEQEVEKAKAVTAAEQRRDVASLDNEAAEQYRQAQLKRADGDATYRKRVMEADGALQQRLDAAVKINQFYADAIKSHSGPWVPNVVMGGSGGSSNGATNLIDLLTAQAAKSVGMSTTNPQQK